MVPEIYQQPNNWPHRFTKSSGEYEGDTGRKYQDMICVHCDLRFIQGKQPRPGGVCPGRTDKKEYRRLQVD